jgi:hypothetical protein
VIKTQLRVPEEVKAWIDREAERNDRSLNGQIVWALKQQMAASAAEPHREETGASVSQTSAPASRDHQP